MANGKLRFTNRITLNGKNVKIKILQCKGNKYWNEINDFTFFNQKLEAASLRNFEKFKRQLMNEPFHNFIRKQLQIFDLIFYSPNDF